MRLRTVKRYTRRNAGFFDNTVCPRPPLSAAVSKVTKDGRVTFKRGALGGGHGKAVIEGGVMGHHDGNRLQLLSFMPLRTILKMACSASYSLTAPRSWVMRIDYR